MFDTFTSQNNEVSIPIVHERVVDKRYETARTIPHQDIAKMHLSTMKNEELDNNWRLNEFFGTIAVINLPKSKQRLKNVSKELHLIGTKVFEVFRAINGRKEVDASIWKKFHFNRENYDTSTEEGRLALDELHKGEAGCYLSHYKLIKRTKDAYEQAMKELALAQATYDDLTIKIAEFAVRKYSSVLILEDDSSFGILNKEKSGAYKTGTGQILRKALLNLPREWDMLYFVVNATEPTERFTVHLRRLNTSWSCVAYAVNSTMYGPLVDELKKIKDPDVQHIKQFDIAISELHHLYKVYAIYPSIVYQSMGKSLISGKNGEDLWQGQPIFPIENLDSEYDSF
jgi:Glycosyltransferase family 25 (LPS biosynthesis protein)